MFGHDRAQLVAAWCVAYVVIHYLFVSQTSQVLALLGVFLDAGSEQAGRLTATIEDAPATWRDDLILRRRKTGWGEARLDHPTGRRHHPATSAAMMSNAGAMSSRVSNQ